jgi:predicted RNase H-like HicB family nuclease
MPTNNIDKFNNITDYNAAFNAKILQILSNIEYEEEVDGRIIADLVGIPGCMVYGETKEDATVKVRALAFKILADLIEHGELDLI